MLKSDETENLPACPSDHRPPIQASFGQLRDPLHSIPDPTQISKPVEEKEAGLKARVDITPTKPKGRAPETMPHFRTPEKQGNVAIQKNRFGWSAIESRNDMANYTCQPSKNGGLLNMTPRTTRATTVARPSSQTETTPVKSMGKPPNAGFAPMSTSRVPGSYSRNGNYAALSRGLPVSNGMPMVVDSVDVPHFDLKEDPSFWIHHNVQVIIRVRPLNSAERGVQGYNRCVKQENSQNINWIGQPESRFTFDHVACETVDQEMLFRKAGLPMVENCLSGYNSCMFAYGQTGSGKTFTMVGDIDDLEFKPSLNRGMTPRIFEYLFARIRAEEESRRDDQLKYSCKCSFLEIYNEQITDLLNPSATNLLLREDMRKGIYVENLSEFEVYSVGDILKLLAQGSLNRKVAATNMNMESSRSHSVFTCVIESKWERESTTNLRFARLNLVDLAGSERQKTSGAEGERLKEAANINKSLSTLGHVIMVLVDVANGKTRHVPYRDSKLTFLLQDSLGGNSKTIIIANISPSTSCAAETLNTLKFAQRAKLIQNNAVVNEDSSGDVSALQHQIQILKEELSALKRQRVSRSLSFGPLSLQYNTEDIEDVDMEIDQPLSEDSVQFEPEAIKMSSQQLKSLEKMVAGALRREHMAETSIKKLEAEIEHLNRLVHQREEDARCSKMKLKFREDKIRRMESLLKGVKTMDSYLLEENASLSEEIKMLQEKVDKNPEVTRFAVENIRLSEELKRFQDFYEEGEREILLSEVSELRDKLIQHYDENVKQSLNSNIPVVQEKSTVPEEKENCEELLKAAEGMLNLELELDILKVMLKEERSSRVKADEIATCLSRELKLAEESIISTHKQYEDLNEQLEEAKSQLLLSVNELEHLKHKNKQYAELLQKKELDIEAFKSKLMKERKPNDCKPDETLFQLRIDNMQASLEKAKMLNASYQRDNVFQKDDEEEVNAIRQQVEEETAQVILCLQDELSALEQQVQDSFCKEKEVESRLTILETTLAERQEVLNAVTCENEALKEQLEEKEKEVELISKEWNLLSTEIEGALNDGNEALIDASEQVESICSYKGKWISEQVHRLIKQGSEKQLVIEDLNACLENANARLNEMECKLGSLRGAALVITESHHKECSEKEKEIHRLRSELSRLSELNSEYVDALTHTELQLEESNLMKEVLLDKCCAASEEAKSQIESLRKEVESAEQCCRWLGNELAKQQEYIYLTEKQLEEYHELDILQTREKLSELQEGVSTMKVSMQISELSLEESSDGDNFILCKEDDKFKACKGYSSISKDATVTLLRKEIESALESLKEVQAEVNRLNAEKQELSISERQTREGLGMLKAQICHILTTVAEFGDLCLYKIKVLNQKVEQVEHHAEEASRSWGQAKEVYESELNNATADVADKTAQASCLFSKFEEAQDMMKEADVMIKGLTIANETMKREMKDLKCVNLSLSSERDVLVQETQNLHSSAALDNHQCHELIQELEIVISQAQNTSEAAILSMSTDISSLKSQILDSRQLIQLWLEDIWSEIIIKDSASLCHMGMLLEAVTGLSAENYLLKNGLSKSVQEIEAFSLLKEKLLTDIKKSFDRVTSKENETAELSANLRTFESKITDLQLQEELLLERSNYLDFGLAKLVKDLNYCNSELEKLLNDSKEATISQEENFMRKLLAKELELVIVTSELHNLADEKADMETSQIACYTVIEHLKKEFVSVSFTSNLMEQNLFERDDEVIQLQKEIGEADLHVNQSCTDIIVLDIIYTVLTEELVLQKKELTFLNEKLDSELREALECREKLSESLQRVENEYKNVTDKLKIMEGEFQSSCGHLSVLDQRTKDLENELKMKDEQLSKMNSEVTLDSELHEALECREKLSQNLQRVENEYKNVTDKLKIMEGEFQASCGQLSVLDQQKKELENELKMKDEQLSKMNSEVISSQEQIHSLVSENCSLQESTREMESNISFLQEELDLRRTDLKELQCSHSSANEKLNSELHEALECREKLSENLQRVENEYKNVTDKLKIMEGEFQSSCGHLSVLDQQKKDLENELKVKDEQLGKMNSEVISSQEQIHTLVSKNCSLQESMRDMESNISFLQEELDLRRTDLKELQCSHSSANEKLNSELHEALECREKMSENLQRVENEYRNVSDKLKIMEGEFQSSCGHLSVLDQQKKDLENELKMKDEQLSKVNSENCSLQEIMREKESNISFLQEELDLRRTDLKELQCSHSSANEELCQKSQELQNHVMELNILEEENVSLKNELSIFQNSTFEDLTKCLKLTKDAEMKSYRMCDMINEKVDIVSDRLCQDICRNLEVVARIEDTLQPLDVLVEDITNENSFLKAELLRKDEILKGLSFDLSLLQESASSSKDQKDEIEAQMKLLERDLTTERDTVELLTKEKEDLTSYVDEILGEKVNLESELNEKKELIKSLEAELVDMENSIDQANSSIESLKRDLKEVSSDRDHLREVIQDLEEKLDTAQALAEECEAISMEAKEIAESNRIYGEEKEEEVRLLEISVQEVDRTVYALENKVDILQEDAERQRLQREELEIELNSLKQQLYNLESADSDIKRHLEEKELNLQNAMKLVQKLEKDLANKETEIAVCKAHITELNLHAEAQASEYKKKFKALEAMAGQVKSEGSLSHGKSSSSNKLEKNGSKTRGSGSPFKCIGIGFAQQLKLEKDEDVTAERLRIQELEALAANRQKEIFSLNNRLAAAESMTHDVIRDLLGVKLDMTNYVSLLDKQEVQKIAESAVLDNGDSEVKVEEISKLKKLLSDFVEERKGWLEEIDRRQAENEVLKVDVEKYKKKVLELESGELNMLPGQQNLQQRIHHHAKIKEENSNLKRENEELCARLRRAETALMAMQEKVVAGLNRKHKHNYFEADKRLSNKLKKAEEERVQLAKELLGLCTTILKAAGMRKASSEISVATAEEALKQLTSKFTSMERELENFKSKSRILTTPPGRASQTPFFSAVDR